MGPLKSTSPRPKKKLAFLFCLSDDLMLVCCLSPLTRGSHLTHAPPPTSNPGSASDVGCGYWLCLRYVLCRSLYTLGRETSTVVHKKAFFEYIFAYSTIQKCGPVGAL